MGSEERAGTGARRAAGARRRRLALLGWWLRRYWIADVAGWLVSVLAGTTLHAWSGRLDVLTAAATVGENVGFYAVVVALELRRRRARGGSTGGAAVARSLLTEFACAELIDTLLVRPLLIALAVHAVGSPVLGITVGGLAADAVFYGLAGACVRASSSPGL